VKLAFRLAFRQLRGGAAGMRIVLACLALGVAAIAAVGSLRLAVDAGLAANGRRILGGDLAVAGGADPLPDALRSWLRDRGARLSDIVQMRSMLIAASGERQLLELKAVDPAWPLLGNAHFDPPQTVGEALQSHDGLFGLVAEQIVLDRLRLKPGDRVRLGNATFAVRGVLADEPDRMATATILAPRALIAAAALPETGLIQPGSMLHYELRAALPAGVSEDAIAARLRAAFPDQGWRLRDARHAVPGVVRFVEQTSLFMTLVGLTALLIGGIGVANGVRAWLDARARSIATLRCLGASGRLVFLACFIEVMTLAAFGIALGLVAGAALPPAAIWLLGDMLPVPPRLGIYPAPLGLAAAYGVLTAASFGLWPLGRTMRIPGGALFRDALIPERTRPGAVLLAANALLAALLVALTVLTAPERGFALWFSATAALTLLLFRAGGWALMRLAAAAPRVGPPWARLGLANLHRPGAATPLMLVSLGLGLSTIAAVALIEGNIRRAILDEIPANAPSFYFIDIQTDQLPRFDAILRAEPGVGEVRRVPSLRARIVAVNGVPAEQVRTTPDTAWALRGDRGLTYAATAPEGTRLVAGAWWKPDYAGPPLVSLDAELARGWGVHPGDTITVNVLGREVALEVANLREIDWRSLSLNFVLVASPGLLSHAPHSNIATVRADPARQGAILRAVTDALPNVTGIPVADVLRAIADLLGKIGAAIGATGSLTLVAGALVLSGAMAAGQRRRTREAVILRALGATRRQIMAAWLVEFGALGGAAGLIAGAVGAAASFGVMRYIMRAGWVFLPAILAATLLAAIALMLIWGYGSLTVALRGKAGPLLRNE